MLGIFLLANIAYMWAAHGPLIASASVDPVKVRPGDMMQISAKISGLSGVSGVSAQMPNELGSDLLNLSLSSGTAYNGTWSSYWRVHDTEAKNYTTKITARDVFGRESYAFVDWSDPVAYIVPVTLNSTLANPGESIGVSGTIFNATNASDVLENNSLEISLDGQQLALSMTRIYPGWSYRLPIAINGSNETLPDYPVNFTVNWTSGMNLTFDDLRFTYYDPVSQSEAQIPYWLGSNVSGVNATVWIRTNLTAGANTVYMYYGKPGAESASNESATFYILNRNFDSLPAGRGWSCATGGPGACDAAYASDFQSSPNSGFAYETGRACVRAHLRQQVALPDISPLYLHYWRKYSCNNWGGPLAVKINATTSDWGSGTILRSWGCGGGGYTSPWEEFWEDISAFRGQTVLIEAIYHDDTDNEASYCNMGDHGASLLVDGFFVSSKGQIPSPVPSIISMGPAQTITAGTNSTGGYSYAFSAPQTAGVHTVRVNFTDPNGLAGENSTNFSVRIGVNGQVVGDVTGTNHIMPGQNFTVLAVVQNSTNGPIDSVWVNLTKPDGNGTIYFLNNLTSRNVAGNWSLVLDLSLLGSSFGGYNLTFFANDTSGLAQQSPAPTAQFFVEAVYVSLAGAPPLLNPGEALNFSGDAFVLPFWSPLANNTIGVYLDGQKQLRVFPVTVSAGSYGPLVNENIFTDRINFNGLLGSGGQVDRNSIRVFDSGGREVPGRAVFWYGDSTAIVWFYANGMIPSNSTATYYIYFRAGAQSQLKSYAKAPPPDVAVQYQDASIAVVRGNYNGSFVVRNNDLPNPGSGSHNNLCIADFDNDGNLDYAISMYGDANVYYYRNGGGGDGFSNFTNMGVIGTRSSTSHFMGCAVADFNKDGNMDFVAFSDTDCCRDSFLGKGDGTFTVTQNALANGVYNREVAVGDFDGDGNMDIIVGHQGDYLWYVYYGDGKGGFTGPVYAGNYGGSNADAYAVAAGDWNHDGRMDAIVGGAYYGYDGTARKKFQGLGNGSRGTAGFTDVGYWTGANGIQIGDGSRTNVHGWMQGYDFNHDGYDDVIGNVYADNVGGQCGVYYWKGNSTEWGFENAAYLGSGPVCWMGHGALSPSRGHNLGFTVNVSNITNLVAGDLWGYAANVLTNSSGGYSYYLLAPQTAGLHFLQVNVTSNGVFAGNVTNFTVRIGVSPGVTGTSTGTAHMLQGQNFTVSAFVRNSTNGPIDSVWANMTMPDNSSFIFFLENQTARASAGVWSRVFNISGLGDLLGNYTIVFFANDSSGLGQQVPPPAHPMFVWSLNFTGNLSRTAVDPGENVLASGNVVLQPGNSTFPNVSIYLDGVLQATVNTSPSGRYNYLFPAPLASGVHSLKVDHTDPNGIYGEQSVNFSVRIYLSRPQGISTRTSTSHANPGEAVNLSVLIPASNLNATKLDRVWAIVSKPDSSLQTVFMAGNSSGGQWSGLFSNTSLLGAYPVVFYANLTGGFNLTDSSAVFYVQTILLSEFLGPSDAGTGQYLNLTFTGQAVLLPDLAPVPDNWVNFYLDGQRVGASNYKPGRVNPYRRPFTVVSNASLSGYHVLLDLTEALYNNTGLVGSWHFTGNSTLDSSGLKNHGFRVGGVDCTVDGRFGKGCSFNGIDSYVDAGGAQSLSPGNYTISLWVKNSSPISSERVLLTKGSGNVSYRLSVLPNGKVRLMAQNVSYNFSWAGNLSFDVNESWLQSVVVDPRGGFAYFGTYTVPGVVVKVNLSDFSRVGNLTFNAGENYLYSAVIDPPGEYAYFGTNTVPAMVVKVRLGDFTRVGNLTLNISSAQSSLMDPVGGFAYFADGNYPANIAKIRLSDFSQVGTLAFPAEGYFVSAVMDPRGGFAYFGTDLGPDYIVKVRLSDFSRVGTLPLGPSEYTIMPAVIDPMGEFGYFGVNTAPGAVVKVRLSDFSRVGSLAFNAGEVGVRTAVIDPVGEFAYFSTNTAPATLVKVRLSDFTRADNITLPEGAVGSAFMDPTGRFAYFGTSTAPGSVVRVRLADFTVEDISSSTALSSNFTHVSAVRGSGNISLFMNGNLESTRASQLPVTASGRLFIGSAGYWAGGTGGNASPVSTAFNGTIDEVRIYGRPLSPLEVQELYNASKSRLDYQDLRFSYFDNATSVETDLPFWQESDNLAWVKANLSAGNNTFYAYYGYNNFTSAGNGSAVFLSFGLKQEGPMAGGRDHTCALRSFGNVTCWGSNWAGQLGDGTTTGSSLQVSVVNLSGVVGISAGRDHNCALLSNGTVACWGYNGNGQLGDGTTTNRYVPVPVANLTDVVAVSAGGYYTCALLSNRTVKCWGYNWYGQLGDGTAADRYVPVPVANLTDVVAISAATGYQHTCALLSDRTVKCWGSNWYGQLGDGTTTGRYVPVPVVGLADAVAVYSGGNHACALRSFGNVTCWGYNWYGQLGDGTTTNSYVPVPVVNLTAVSLSAGREHNCALLSNGTVKCWGYNSWYGQLGDGTMINSNVPVSVANLTDVVAINRGLEHTCALLGNGSAKCWGDNWYGQLGDGTSNNYRTAPVPVSNYDLGGRFDRTSSVYSTAHAGVDEYFIRNGSYSIPELRSVGPPQLSTGTSPSGNYNLTFPAPLTASWQSVDVNVTDAFGIYGRSAVHNDYYLKAYLNGSPESFFAANDTVEIRAFGAFTAPPLLSIVDSSGSRKVPFVQMANTSSAEGPSFSYNYTVNGSVGWWNVSINTRVFQAAFYVGQKWPAEWTDADGRTYPFRIAFNVSGPGAVERYFEPVDVPLDFVYGAHNNSVRIVQHGGSRRVEVPSRLYNLNRTVDRVNSAGVVFLSTLGRNSTKGYYAYYSRSDAGAPAYLPMMSVSNRSSYFEVGNGDYRLLLNGSRGGVVGSAFSNTGSGRNLGGFSPMQMSPSVSSGPYQYRASDLANPSVSVQDSGFRAAYSASGTVGTIDYVLKYTFFPQNPYFLIETNVTARTSESWDFLKSHYLFFGEGIFSGMSFANSSGVFTQPVEKGDGSDYVFGGTYWTGFFNNDTGDSIGDVVLVSSPAPEQSSFSNMLAYDSYEQRQHSGAVSAGSNFYSKVGRVMWRVFGNYRQLNETYLRLSNPVSYASGGSETSDSLPPVFSVFNQTPTAPDDSQNVTCFSYWTDNLELDYAVVRVNSSGYNNESLVSLRVNESWINYTIPAEYLEAGPVVCNVTVFDLAGLSNSTAWGFSVSDSTPPAVILQANSPSTEAGLDPNRTVTVSAIIAEYSGVASVILQYRGGNDSAWRNVSMAGYNTTAYLYSFSANFTPTYESVWYYRIFANDSQGHAGYGSTTNLSVYYDWTWDFSPADFGVKTVLFNKNVTVGSLLLNNTGDKPLSFRVTSNWDESHIFFNNTMQSSGYYLTVQPGEVPRFNVTVAAVATSERSDSLTITLDALNSSAQPDAGTSNATIISFAGGPFLFLTFTEYNASATQGDSGLRFRVRLQNKGNESASGVNLWWALPSGWAVASGNLYRSVDDLGVDSFVLSDVTANVGDSAPVGTQAVSVFANSSGNKTGSASVNVVVAARPSTIKEKVLVGGGGGGGGGSGGGNLVFVGNESPFWSGGFTREQRNMLFSTSEKFELVRGKDVSFPLVVRNPLGGTLENISFSVSGYLSNYISIVPERLDSLGPNESFEFRVWIAAPKYFNTGRYDLDFVISGFVSQTFRWKNLTTVRVTSMEEERSVVLFVHDLDRQDAVLLLNESGAMVSEMRKEGFNVKGVSNLMEQGGVKLKAGDYEAVKDLTQQISSSREQAFSAREELGSFEVIVAGASRKGLSTPDTLRLINLAKAGFSRGDYAAAKARIEEARLTYALETKGEFNVIYFIRDNFGEVVAVSVAFVLFSLLLFFNMKHIIASEEISRLRREERILIGLMKTIQHDCFEEKKMSMEEYDAAMLQYENRLSSTIHRLIETEAVKANIFRIGGSERRFLQERERLVGEIKKAQSDFIEEGKTETRSYEHRMKSFVSRLSEVEERLASIEAERYLKENGAWRRLLRRVYLAS